MRNLFSFSAILFSMGLLAQTDKLGSLEMNVMDKYKASVREAVKVKDFPDFSDTTSRKLPVQYRIQSQALDFQFKPEPLPPARIVQVPVEKLQDGWVRAGYGLYNTSLAEVYYNSGRSSDLSYGILAKHLASQGGVKNIAYDNNSLAENQIHLFVNKFYPKVKWSSDVFAEFDKSSYYGRQALSDSSDTEIDPPSNWYRRFGFRSGLSDTRNKGLGMFKKIDLAYYHLNDNWQSRENEVQVNTALQLPALDKNLDLDLNFTYLNTRNDSLNIFNQDWLGSDSIGQDFFSVQLRPSIKTTWEDVLFEFGINLYNVYQLNSYEDEGNNSLYFFPEIKASFPVVDEVLSLHAGVSGHMKLNSIYTTTSDNPFLEPGQALNPTRQMDFYAGMQGILSASTSFNLRGGYKSIKDMLIYYRNPFYNLTDSRSLGLNILYDDVNLFYVRGELLFNWVNNLEINLAGELNSFAPENLAFVYHRPAFTSSLSAIYTLKEKLKFNTVLEYIGKREAFNAADFSLDQATLDPYLYGKLGIEYLYNSRLSAFINVYNLFNSSYQHYLGYDAQGINVLLGIGYRF